MVENFRRGVIQRMGFGLEELRAQPEDCTRVDKRPRRLRPPLRPRYLWLDARSQLGHVIVNELRRRRALHIGLQPELPRSDRLPIRRSGYCAVQGAERSNTAIHIDISQRDTAAFIMGPALELVANGSDDHLSIKAALSNSVFDGMVLSGDAWIAVHIPDWQRLTTADLNFQLPRQMLISTPGLALVLLWKSRRHLESQLRCPTFLSGKAMFDAEANKGSGIFAHFDESIGQGFPFKFAHSEMTIHTESPTVRRTQRPILNLQIRT